MFDGNTLSLTGLCAVFPPNPVFIVLALLPTRTQIADYKDAEQKARKQHKGIWQYGDSTEDQAGEFGLSR